jgi:hypothetical protein
MLSRNKKKQFVIFAQRSQQAQFFLLIASLQVWGFIGLFILGATAQSNLNSIKQTPTVQPKKTNVSTPQPSKQKSILESLLSLLQRKSFLGGSRTSGGFCGIAPAVLGTSNVIWSDRPLFLWQGKVQNLELRPYSFDVDSKDQSTLWSVVPTDQQASYPNEPLQAGQRYEWQATYFSPQTNEPIQWQHTFQVMEKAERDRIAQDLQSLDMQLKIQNATAEEAALARANYFAAKDLWSDALQQIYAVGYPFSAGSRFLQAATDRVCHTKSTNLVDLGQNTKFNV